MTQTQKIIKYFAISLAVLIIVSIFYATLGIISNIFGFSLSKENNEYKSYSVRSDIYILDLDIAYSKLTFKLDSEFKVETNTEYVNVLEKNNKLEIKEKTRLFSKNINNEIIVYLPSNKLFEEISIESGSGSINIENLKTNKLELDLGAGAIKIDDLLVNKEAKINSGAGEVIIANAIINNLDFDMGVGKTELNAILKGSTEIDAGVGELVINLNDSISNYNFKIDKGLGEIKINNESVSNGYQYGTGTNILDIDGGIGSISINTLN